MNSLFLFLATLMHKRIAFCNVYWLWRVRLVASRFYCLERFPSVSYATCMIKEYSLHYEYIKTNYLVNSSLDETLLAKFQYV